MGRHRCGGRGDHAAAQPLLRPCPRQRAGLQGPHVQSAHGLPHRGDDPVRGLPGRGGEGPQERQLPRRHLAGGGRLRLPLHGLRRPAAAEHGDGHCPHGPGGGARPGRADDGLLPVPARVFRQRAGGGLGPAGPVDVPVLRHGNDVLRLPDPGPGRGAGRRGPGREGQGQGRRYHPGWPGLPALPAGDGLPGLFPDRGDHGGAAAGPAGSGDRHGVLRHLGHGRLAVHPGRLLHLEADVSCRRTKNTHQTRNTGPTRRPVFRFF